MMQTSWVLFLFAATAIAQEAEPRRSMADGLVRQLVEVERYELPRLQSGREVGAGKGPMVLLIVQPNGTATLRELQRGYGDLGKEAQPQTTTETQEIEEGKPAPKALAPTIWITRQGATIRVGTSTEPAAVSGEKIDREALARWFAKLAKTTEDSPVAGELVVQPGKGTSTQDVLTIWEIARAHGFSKPMIGGGAGGSLPQGTRDLLHGIADEHEWETKKVGPQRICTGELLVLLNGDVAWPTVCALFMECAQAGIWQIGFVGSDGKSRFKLPMNLPFDEVLLK